MQKVKIVLINHVLYLSSFNDKLKRAEDRIML